MFILAYQNLMLPVEILVECLVVYIKAYGNEFVESTAVCNKPYVLYMRHTLPKHSLTVMINMWPYLIGLGHMYKTQPHYLCCRPSYLSA